MAAPDSAPSTAPAAPQGVPAAVPEAVPPPGPVVLTSVQRATRIARRTARYSAWSLLGLLLLSLALVASFWFWSARAQSLETVLRLIRGYLPPTMTLQAEGVTGTVRRGGHIERLIWTHHGTEADGYTGGRIVVTLDDITVAWRLASIVERSTNFSEVRVRNATLQDTRTAKPLTEPKQQLQSLILPLGVTLPFDVETLRIVGRPETENIEQDSPAQAAAAASAAKRAEQQKQADQQRQRLARPSDAASAAAASQLAASAAAIVASAAKTGPLELPAASTAPAVAPASHDTVLTHIKGRYGYDRLSARHTLELDSLAVANGQWQARASVEGRAPMQSRIEALGVLDVPASTDMAAQRLQASAAIEGTLAGADALLQVQAQVAPLAAGAAPQVLADKASAPAEAASAQAADAPAALPPAATTGPWLHVRAGLHPWKTQPLARARAQWQQLDVQAFWPQAPRTRLDGTLVLEPVAPAAPVTAGSAPAAAPAQASAAPEGRAPGMLGFLGNSHWQLALHTRNADSGPLDKSRLPVQQLDLQAHYRAGALDVPQLALQVSGGGSLQGQGQYRPEQGWQGHVDVRSLNPGLIDGRFAAAPISGTLVAQATQTPGQALTQTPVDFSIRLASDGGSKSRAAKAAKGLAVDVVDVQGQWQPQAQTLEVPQLLVRTSDAALQGSLGYAVPAQAGQADVRLSLPGSSARLKGNLAAASGQGNLEATVADLQKTMQWLQQWPGTESLRQQVVAGNAGLNAQWRGGWQNNGKDLRLTARLDAPVISVRAAQAPPAQATLIERTTLSLQGTLAQTAIEADTHIRQDTRQIEAGLRGSMDKLAQGWQAQLQSTRLALREQVQDQSRTATLARPVQIRVLQTGSGLQAQTDAFQIDLADSRMPGQAHILAEPVRFVQPAGGGYTLSSKGRLTDLPLAWIDALGGSALSGSGLSGDLALAGDWDVQLGHNLRLQASLQRSQGDLIVMAGDGSSSRVRAGIRQALLELTGSGSQLRARLTWDSANAGTVRADVQTALSRSAGGGWSLPPNAPLAGTLQASLPRMGLWSVFAPPGWRMRGTLQADARFGGTLAAPQVFGMLNADDLGVRSVVDGIEFSQGKLRTRLSGQRLDVDEFSLQGPAVNRAPGGSARITGHVQWGAPGASLLQSLRMELDAQLQSLQLSSMSERQIVLSGDIKAQLAQQRLTVRGGLRVNRALIDIPNDIAPKLDSDVVIRASQRHPKAALAQPAAPAPAVDGDIAIKPRNTAKPSAADAPAAPAKTAAGARVKSPAPRRAAAAASRTPRAAAQNASQTTQPPKASITPDIHVTIDMGDDLRVRGMGLDTRLRGQLTVKNGDSLRAMPRLTGAIHTDRGTFRAYGQELDIESGHITFNSAIDNPTLDIVAVRPNLPNDMRVGVRIRGTAQNPQVQLFSAPAMSDSEKLSWLVLGRPSAGAADAALLQQAALALLAGNGRGIAGELADALGLDELSFQGGSDGSVSGGSVTLGKRFSKNFYVAYERGLDATVSALYFFYDISRNLRLRGQTGTDSAIDLIYTISYD